MSSAMDFYSLDYRIRRCIRQLLEQRQPDADSAFQLALCNYIGFGGPREEESLNIALQSSGRTREELEDVLRCKSVLQALIVTSVDYYRLVRLRSCIYCHLLAR